jgi:DNA-directed RNA polymerase subunit omega
MARITVEDCIEKVDNRFQLVLLSARRTRQLMRGSKVLIESDGNKDIVNSLREIAASKVQVIKPEPHPEDDQQE